LAAGGRSDSFAPPFPVGPLQAVVGSPPTIGAGDFGTEGLVALPEPQFHRLGGFQVGGKPRVWAFLEPIEREVFWVEASGQGKLVELYTPGGVRTTFVGGQ
jgi:hypothetical protein